MISLGLHIKSASPTSITSKSCIITWFALKRSPTKYDKVIVNRNTIFSQIRNLININWSICFIFKLEYTPASLFQNFHVFIRDLLFATTHHRRLATDSADVLKRTVHSSGNERFLYLEGVVLREVEGLTCWRLSHQQLLLYGREKNFGVKKILQIKMFIVCYFLPYILPYIVCLIIEFSVTRLLSIFSCDCFRRGTNWKCWQPGISINF